MPGDENKVVDWRGMEIEYPKDFKLFQKKETIKAVQMHCEFRILTSDKTMVGRAGDYLCIGSKGDLVPCPKEVFEASFEEAKQ